MGKIKIGQLGQVRHLYYDRKLSMAQVAGRLGVSLDALLHFMRKNNLPRRSLTHAQQNLFAQKPASFSVRKSKSLKFEKIRLAGAMLYWAEGYKSDKGHSVDFANSDPAMITMFLKFLRAVYVLDERRLRVLLYAYSDQDIAELIKFWSGLTKIPLRQFTKPYIRDDFVVSGVRKMTHGLIHIRYADKKLLLAIKDLINYYKIALA